MFVLTMVSNNSNDTLQSKFPLEKATPISAKRGEVVVFSYLLIHGSYLNLSDRVRRMYLVQVSFNFTNGTTRFYLFFFCS